VKGIGGGVGAACSCKLEWYKEISGSIRSVKEERESLR
jgi:hypothetical protein